MRAAVLVALATCAVASPSASSATSEAGSTRIVFSAATVYERGAYDWQLYSALPSGKGLAQLTFAPEQSTKPVPSPDGALIAFSRSGALWVMRPDGRGQRRLAPSARDPAWAPDSRSIAYVTSAGIRVVRAGGEKSRLLVRGGRSPSFSRNGALAFARTSPEGFEVVVRRDGRDRHVTDVGVLGQVELSPDGRWLALSVPSGLSSYPVLKIYRVDARRPRLVHQSPARELAWSPRSDLVAFIDPGGLFMLNVRTGAGRYLGSRHPVLSVLSLDWSPRGDEIAYALGYSSGTGKLERVSLRGRVLDVPLVQGLLIGDDLAWSQAGAALRLRAPLPLALALGDELRTRALVDELAADDHGIAYRSCGTVGAWGKVGSAPATLRREPVVCADEFGLARGTTGLARAGETVAWSLTAGGNTSWTWLEAGSTESNETVTIASNVRTRGDPRGTARNGKVVGAHDLLAFSTWMFCDDLVPSPPSCLATPIHERPVVSESIWRAREAAWPGTCPLRSGVGPTANPAGRCQELATEPGPFTPVDVSEGRIVAVGTNAVVLLASDGRRLLEIPARARSAQLSGPDLVVQVGGELRHYDSLTGVLVRAYPGRDITPVDMANGMVAYVAGDEARLFRLSDGADAVVASATTAKFGDSGLFYAYEGAYPWRGRIRFVPFDELPLR